MIKEQLNNERVGIIVSPGYGAGFSTWNSEAIDCEKDIYIIDLILHKQNIEDILGGSPNNSFTCQSDRLKKLNKKTVLNYICGNISLSDLEPRKDLSVKTMISNLHKNGFCGIKIESIPNFEDYSKLTQENQLFTLLSMIFDFENLRYEFDHIVITPQNLAHYKILLGILVHNHCTQKYNQGFFFPIEDFKDLRVEWLEKSMIYKIEEYDGEESLRVNYDSGWKLA